MVPLQAHFLQAANIIAGDQPPGKVGVLLLHGVLLIIGGQIDIIAGTERTAVIAPPDGESLMGEPADIAVYFDNFRRFLKRSGPITNFTRTIATVYHGCIVPEFGRFSNNN